MSDEQWTPGKVPPALSGTAAFIPAAQEWDPEGDIHLPLLAGSDLYVPTIVRAPPQSPTPEQHPKPRPQFPPRGYERFFTTTPGSLTHQLNFTASAVRVDNYSSHWIYFQSAGIFVPPFIYGAILQLQPGVSVAQWVTSPPQGYADPTPVLESAVVTMWFEDDMVNSPGVPIQSSFRQGAAGGAYVTGPITLTGSSSGTNTITADPNSSSGNLTIQAGPAGVLRLGSVGGVQWFISGGGAFTPTPDASFDLGASGSRARNIYAITLATGVKAGAAVDGDVTNPLDGMLRVDSTNGRLYVRYGGAWHYATLT